METELIGTREELLAWSGCVKVTRARQTGALVAVVRSAESGVDEDPANPWATWCEDHGQFVTHETRRLAEGWASEPASWCPGCQARLAGTETEWEAGQA